jgi:redox-sensitive bicupin YhaK (pirin superfamily)
MPRLGDTPDDSSDATESIQLVIAARDRDIGGFAVRRVLPWIHRRRVGPFVFFDHMGPAELAPGKGLDVRPHPHIGLSTVTYLFDGEIVHRDSLGSHQPIRPGDVNWMVAGRGIVHSERTGDTDRRSGSRLHGIQAWLGLPLDVEEAPPRFDHHPVATLPVVEADGVRLTVIAGTAYGSTSPVVVASPTFYVDALLAEGAIHDLGTEYEERALYVAEGAISCGGQSFTAGTMLVFHPDRRAALRADAPSRVMLLGGAPIGERHVYWNFVASTEVRIENAKRDWRDQRFPKIPGDDREFVPLPDDR